MTTPDRPDRSVGLPLTEPHDANASSTLTENHIRSLVDTFYGTVRDDAVIGPIFDRHVQDWSQHLPKMYDFWSTVVLRTGRYAGRPIEAHERIPGLTASHFDRWLTLWKAAVERTIPPDSRHTFIWAAERMASSMIDRLDL